MAPALSTTVDPLAPDHSPLRFRIYLEDTDAGGIVYHTSYLRFMERARTEALRRAGVQQSEGFKSDLSFVLHSMNLRFHSAAVLDSEVTVSCELKAHRGASLEFLQVVRDVATSEAHCSAEVVVACISIQSKRPRRIPPDVALKLALVAGPLQPTKALHLQVDAAGSQR
jgi:4-hydroxybenzoyl-CoA thioesterase